jgi:transcriptional regulator with XRE-family HTH domain
MSPVSNRIGMMQPDHDIGADHIGGNDDRNQRKASAIDVHVGTRVRLRRMLLGMSQEKLGECLGLTFQQIQKYEKGVNRIGASRLYELAKVLSVSVNFFYEEIPGAEGVGVVQPGLADGKGQESYIAEFLGSREGLELNRAFLRIQDPKVRRSVIDLVRSLAGDDQAAG